MLHTLVELGPGGGPSRGKPAGQADELLGVTGRCVQGRED